MFPFLSEQATIDTSGWSAFWAALGAALVAIISAAGTLYAIFRKESRQDNTAVADERRLEDNAIAKELKSIITRCEKQINRQQTQIENYERTVEELRNEHTACKVQMSELYGWLRQYHDYLIRQAQTIRELGRDPGKLPDLPPNPLDEEENQEQEFKQRTLEQGKELIKEVDKRIVKPKSNSGMKAYEDPNS